MRGFFADHGPQRRLELVAHAQRRLRSECVSHRSRQHVEHAFANRAAEIPNQAITDGIRGSTRPPALDQSPVLPEFRVVGDRIFIDGIQEQALPARQEQRAIVELYGQHVLRNELLPRQQSVAYLARPRSEVVAAVTDFGQCIAVDDPRIGGPDASALRVQDARIFLGRQPTGPATRNAPVSRQKRVVGRTPGNLPGDRPADIAARIADHEVLWRQTHAVRDVERFCGARRHFEIHPVQVDCSCLVREPADGDQALITSIDFTHRPPDRFTDPHFFGIIAPDVNRFEVSRELSLPIWRLVGVRCVTRPYHNCIGPVAVAVGITPGNVPVAAGDEQRHAGQCYAVQIAAQVALDL